MTDPNRATLENVNQLKDRLIAAVDRLTPEITAVAADIFAHPELGRQEVHASELLTQHLTAAGFSVQQPAAGMPTAFIAGLDGAAPGATIALLAEYDALPELGHACGHNLIAAASLGAALALAEVMPELNGRLLCIGTPDEEGPGGKLDHVRAGTFNGVDAALMFHPSDRTLVDTHGLALQQFELVWEGKPAHCAAAPDQGINALSGAIQTFVAIDAFRQHLRPDARINGIITDGGKRPNIFPERAAASFTLRAGTSEYLDEVIAGFTACVQGAAAATRTKVTILPGERFDDLRNTPALVELFTANLNRLGEPIDVGEPGLGSTDMGNVTHVIPGLHPYIKTGPAGAACHTHGFLAYAGGSEGQRAVLVAAKALALTALDLFVSPETVARVRASFNLALSK
jgi:amidohydrolase